MLYNCVAIAIFCENLIDNNTVYTIMINNSPFILFIATGVIDCNPHNSRFDSLLL